MKQEENYQNNESAMQQLVDQLREHGTLSADGLKKLLADEQEAVVEYLCKNAREVCDQYYGKKIYARGLIEFTNYCRNNCYYCGIRCGNKKVERYRLSENEILSCVDEGYQIGFRTFVLQGGEDAAYTVQKLGAVICRIKEAYPDCAVTLSFGEWDTEVYQYWYSCGADRYLLRHETADKAHYHMLHPKNMSFRNRRNCLRQLKKIGYQIGAGIMTGSPGQTLDMLVEDLYYLKELQPHMAGIGPFIPQKDTPFSKEAGGTLLMTLKMLAIIRLMLPKILLPSTTALGSIYPDGRERGILAGANVVMPNLSPENVRNKYVLYDNKISTGAESAQKCRYLAEKLYAIGYELCMERGDSLMQEIKH